jgi:hypothetical protein
LRASLHLLLQIPREDRMTAQALPRRRLFLALSAFAAAALAAPEAFALNPQPLPPGMRRAPMYRGRGHDHEMMMRRRRMMFMHRHRH